MKTNIKLLKTYCLLYSVSLCLLFSLCGCISYSSKTPTEKDKFPKMKEWPAYEASGNISVTSLPIKQFSLGFEGEMFYDSVHQHLFVFAQNDTATDPDRARILQVFENGRLLANTTTTRDGNYFSGDYPIDEKGNARFGNTIFLAPAFTQQTIIPTVYLTSLLSPETSVESKVPEPVLETPKTESIKDSLLNSIVAAEGSYDTLHSDNYATYSILCNKQTNYPFVLQWEADNFKEQDLERLRRVYNYIPLAAAGTGPRNNYNNTLYDAKRLAYFDRVVLDNRWFSRGSGNHFVASGSVGFEPLFMNYYKLGNERTGIQFKCFDERYVIDGCIREQAGLYLFVKGKKEEVYYISGLKED